MGAGASNEEKGRRIIAQGINSGGRELSEKHMRMLLRCYDRDNTGVLRWNEARRYLSDLLELSGKQAVVIREAREAGHINVAQAYDDFLRSLFDALDTNHDGAISIEELVQPSSSSVNDLMEAVRALSAHATPPSKTPLVLSSKMRVEPSIPAELVAKGTLCVAGCGFFGSPDKQNYCSSCYDLVFAPEQPAPTAPPATAPPPLAKAPSKPPTGKRVLIKRRKPKPKPTAAPTPTASKGKEEVSDDDDDGGGSDVEAEADGEVSGGGDDVGDFLETSNREHHSKFSVITGDQVEQLMGRKINDAAELLQLIPDKAALVLMFFDWNLARLQERYFLDVDKNLKLAGVTLPDGEQPRTVSGGECSICFDDVKLEDTATLDCGHGPFCRNCYREYLHERVSSGGANVIFATNCMGTGCKLRLSPLQWKRIAQPDDYKRYQYFYLKSYVESSPNLGFCPNPACTYVVKFSGLGRPQDVVECMCGKKYCFACCGEAHNPISCDQLTVWMGKNNSDAESILYIQATSKQCPHCGLATERNEGCNHMTCRRDVGGCGGEWCWMCRGDWRTHGSKTGGYFSCNLYDKSKAKSFDEGASKMLEEAQHFSHFYDRFVNHGSMEREVEVKREACVTEWMPKYRTLTGGLDPTFLLSALELVVKCRHVLKMTYVYAWFADSAIKKKQAEPKATKKLFIRRRGTRATEAELLDELGGAKTLESMLLQQELFNFQQGNLEGITDRLAELLFSFPRSPETFEAEELRNLLVVTQQFLKGLVEGFESQGDDEELQ